MQRQVDLYELEDRVVHLENLLVKLFDVLKDNVVDFDTGVYSYRPTVQYNEVEELVEEIRKGSTS